jgi:tetratricopeptide (TPR) repeat protein
MGSPAEKLPHAPVVRRRRCVLYCRRTVGRLIAIAAVVWGLWAVPVSRAQTAGEEGEAQTPAEGEAQTPAEGEAQTPAEGEAQTPAEGEATRGEPDAELVADEMARGLFQAGRAAYNAGRYEEALGYFRQAYDRSPRPELLFNIGQSADRLRMDDLALDSFRRYLAELPRAENREQVQNRVRALERVVAEREAREAEQPAREPEPVSPAPVKPRVQEPAAAVEPSAEEEERRAAGGFPLGPMLVAGGGLAAIGVGLAFGAAAESKQEQYASAPVRTRQEAEAARSLFDQAESQALVCNLMLGLGAAAVIGGALWFALALPDSDSEAVHAGPLVAPDGDGIALGASLGGAL